MGEIGEHFRGYKSTKSSKRIVAERTVKQNERRTTKIPPTLPTPPREQKNNTRCWDWVMVSGTSHYTKNRSSFSTYQRAPCEINQSPFPSGPTLILGVWTVKLEMVCGPKDPKTYTLVLENVLHMPTTICNGINITLLARQHNSMLVDIWDNSVSDKYTGEPLFYGRYIGGISRAVIEGNPRGVTYLRDWGGLSAEILG